MRVLTLTISSILIFLHVESIYHSIWIKAQRFLFGMNLLRKRSRCLDITIMLQELEDLQMSDAPYHPPLVIQDIPVVG